MDRSGDDNNKSITKFDVLYLKFFNKFELPPPEKVPLSFGKKIKIFFIALWSVFLFFIPLVFFIAIIIE